MLRTKLTAVALAGVGLATILTAGTANATTAATNSTCTNLMPLPATTGNGTPVAIIPVKYSPWGVYPTALDEWAQIPAAPADATVGQTGDLYVWLAPGSCTYSSALAFTVADMTAARAAGFPG